MQGLKKNTRLVSLIGMLFCLVIFSSISDALIDVSHVIPDNGPFNSKRLDAEDVKALGNEKAPRRITIYGTGFTRYMDVEFVTGNISKPVAEFKYISPTQVRVIPPDWKIPSGKNPVTVDIEVTSQSNVGNRDVLKNGFTYNLPPEVENIVPNIGPQDPSLLPGGKEIIEIKGVGFVKDDPTRPGRSIQVVIGTKRFTPPAVLYQDSRHISLEFSEPLYNAEGNVDIIVINPDRQTSAVGERQYKIIGAPTIKRIRPGRGPIEGKNVVEIDGSGLEGSRFSVRVNGQDTRASSPTDMIIVFTMPEGVEKKVNVQVIKHTVNQRGRSFDQISNPLKYTYLDLVVHRVKPDVGEKGTKVTIIGEDFFISTEYGLHQTNSSDGERSTVEVFFGGEIRDGKVIGGTKGVNLEVIDSTRLTVEVPEGSGIVPVFVQQSWEAGVEYQTTDPYVRQVMMTENKFTYTAGVVIDDFKPKKGPVVGGTAVTITGANFYPNPNKIKVTFGGVQTTVLDAGREELHVRTPPHGVGIVVVTVQNPDGSSDSLDGFEYLQGPVIEKVEPNFGPLEGGNPTVILGKQLLKTSSVRFGGRKATLGARENSKVIVNAVPKKIAQAGSVDVIAYVVGQPDAVLQNGYTYQEIEARAIVPDNGPLSGNNTVTIQGRDFEGWDYDTEKAIAPTVQFGRVKAKVISYTKDSIEVVAPKIAGTVKVTITVRYLFTTPGETMPKEVKQTNADLTYRYNPMPVIASFRPLAGNKGDNLFIEGSGFLAGAEVKVGTTTIQPVSVTGTQIRVIVPEPKKNECEVDIVVVNPDGQEATAPDRFEYLDCTSTKPPPDDECSHPEDGWRATLKLASGDNSTTLTFGIDPEATDGFNPGLDSAAPPPAPGAQFNAVFTGDFVDLVADIRGFDQLENSWTVKLTSKDSVTFEADVNEIPECFLVQLGNINLRTQISVSLQPGEHILTVKPGEPIDETITVTIPLERGWNLISFPGELVHPSPQSILGGSVIQILDGYSIVPAAPVLGEGYWVLSIAPINLEVVLKPATKYTRAVKRGWNLIGSVIYDVSMPEGVIQLASWNAKTQEYESPTTILPTVGYWAFVLEDRDITVSTSPPSPPAAPSATSLETLWTLPLTLTDTKGVRTTLEMGIATQATSGYDQNLDRFVPPPAPNSQNALSAGFLFEQDSDLSLRYAQGQALQRSVITMTEDGEARWSLRVSSLDSETILHWDAGKISPEWSLQLVDGNRRVDMSKATTYRISQGVREIQLVLRRKPQEIKPSESMLLQNFPNPFNPETWIPYQLADSTEVSLTIYDVHGRTIRQLNLGHKVAGIYTDRGKAAYWNGRNDFGERVSSGLYFYRLKAGNFSAMRRMVIVK